MATLVDRAPEGAEWVHELKYDGYRIVARRHGGDVTLLSRRANDWTAKFPGVRDAIGALPSTSCVLDGEVAVLLPDGRTSFQGLQNAFGRKTPDLVYFVFDLLFLDGEDLRPRPLEARKAALRAFLARGPKNSPIRYSDHVEGNGGAFWKQVCGRGLEGIISKRRDQPYTAGRGNTWLKIKCLSRQEFVIGGFTEPEGSRHGLGALLVGHYADGKLVFAGKVGTGFSQKMLGELRRRLDPLAQKSCPFVVAPPTGWLGRNAHWVKPQLVAEVVFFEWTEDGRLRHPSFQGLREDKDPRDVRRETPEGGGVMQTNVENKPKRARGGGDCEVAGVRISHPERVLYPDAGFTKLELARYYEAIAPHMLPHVAGRPLTLVRCPSGLAGDCFYMRHSRVWAPPALRKVHVPEQKKQGEYLIVDDVAGLVSLAQMDVLEIHTWNSRLETLERPDRFVLDLDPGPEVAWKEVMEAARLIRAALHTLKLESFVKTTGGKGLHVVVPLEPVLGWDPLLDFTRAIAELIAREHPRRYTTAMPKAGREDKILIDFLRNNRTATAVAAFSSRARPPATVSVPLAWDELTAKLRPDELTIATVPKRLARQSEDPWARFFKVKQRVPEHLVPAEAPPAKTRKARAKR